MLKFIKNLFKSKDLKPTKAAYEPRYKDRVRIIGGFYRGQEGIVYDVCSSGAWVYIDGNAQVVSFKYLESK